MLVVWHERAVFYQVYPLSFQDSDGDGRGDLAGISARLDHLSWLGIDAVWLCPMYPSPMRDFGYDISDYQNVDPSFGSLEEFDRLLAEIHARDMRLILDFVPNHTSSAHPWFIESRSSSKNPKRDWYIWVDPKPGGSPPNNWLSRFGGSAWEWDAERHQFYLHSFLKSQPDLNLRNPEVRSALADVMRFWLRRGVDGFRVDAAAVLAKDELLRDDPPNPDFTADSPPPERFKREYSDTRPEAIDWLAEMRAVADEFPERVLLGEVDTHPDRIAGYYGSAAHPALHLPLNYLLLETPWQAQKLAAAITDYLARVPSHGWPFWALGGQDKKRIASRVDSELLPCVALLAFTLRGAALFYAGDEIGMEQAPLSSERALDPFARLVPGYGLNRDPERTPMQWSSDKNAGFTSGSPWLPVAPDYATRNVAAQQSDPRSLLSVYRELIAIRHREPALRHGAIERVAANGEVFHHVRQSSEQWLDVLMNLGSKPQSVPLRNGRVLFSTHGDRADERVTHSVLLRRSEGLIIERDRGNP